MADITESPSSSLIQAISEEQFEILNSIKPQLLTALHEDSFLSQLHQELDEKSKRMRFNDIITYHPHTSVDFRLKELISCFVSKWYSEFLENNQIIVSDIHRREYPLTVLLSVVLQCIANHEIICVDSEREDTGHDSDQISDPELLESNQYDLNSEIESLCPVWQRHITYKHVLN